MTFPYSKSSQDSKRRKLQSVPVKVLATNIFVQSTDSSAGEFYLFSHTSSSIPSPGSKEMKQSRQLYLDPSRVRSKSKSDLMMTYKDVFGGAISKYSAAEDDEEFENGGDDDDDDDEYYEDEDGENDVSGELKLFTLDLSRDDV